MHGNRVNIMMTKWYTQEINMHRIQNLNSDTNLAKHKMGVGKQKKGVGKQE